MALTVHLQNILRNKRCLLAYMQVLSAFHTFFHNPTPNARSMCVPPNPTTPN